MFHKQMHFGKQEWRANFSQNLCLARVGRDGFSFMDREAEVEIFVAFGRPFEYNQSMAHVLVLA